MPLYKKIVNCILCSLYLGAFFPYCTTMQEPIDNDNLLEECVEYSCAKRRRLDTNSLSSKSKNALVVLTQDPHFFLNFLTFLTNQEIGQLAMTCRETHHAINDAYDDPEWALSCHEKLMQRFNPANECSFTLNEGARYQTQGPPLHLIIKGIFATPYLAWVLSYPGIDVNAYDGSGFTPLHYCILHAQVATQSDGSWQETAESFHRLELLMAHPRLDVNKTSKTGRTALEMVVNSRPCNQAKLLLLMMHPQIDLSSALQRAMTWQDEQAVMLLLHHPAAPLDDIAEIVFKSQHGEHVSEGGISAVWHFIERDITLLKDLLIGFHHTALYKEYLQTCLDIAWKCRCQDGIINTQSLHHSFLFEGETVESFLAFHNDLASTS